MPKWATQDEEKLREVIMKGESLEYIALLLKRSPDAVAMKSKRMGLPVPMRKSESFPRKRGNKVTNVATTTTHKLEPVDTPDLPSLRGSRAIMGCH